PITGEPVQFAFSTVERWLHLARKAAGHGDTVRALRRKIRKDAGTRRSVSSAVVVAVVAQHKAHPTWSYHYARVVVMRSPCSQHPEFVRGLADILRIIHSAGLRGHPLGGGRFPRSPDDRHACSVLASRACGADAPRAEAPRVRWLQTDLTPTAQADLEE